MSSSSPRTVRGTLRASSSGRRRGLDDDHPTPRNLLVPGWASKGMGLGLRWVMPTFGALSLVALVAGGVGLASPERTPAHPEGSPAVIAQAEPAAQPWDVQAIDPVGPLTAWALLVQAEGTGPTWAEELAVTTNGGRSWADRTPPGVQPGSLSRYISQAGATGPADAWATYSPISGEPTTQTFLATTDAGLHWEELGPLPSPECSPKMLSAAVGFCIASDGAMGVAPVTIYRTSDGGHRWALESRSASAWPGAEPGTPGALSAGCDKFVGFSTPADGWATFLCPQGLSPVAGSTDGGRTWTARPLAPLPAFYRVSPNDGFAQWDSPPVFDGKVGAVGLDVDLHGETSIVYRSTDGGDSWRPVVPPGRPRDWSVDIVSGLTWKLVAGRTILTTTNGGQSWRAATSNLAFSPGDRLDFVTARTGWYTPYDSGALYRTTDGGRTWAGVALPGFPVKE